VAHSVFVDCKVFKRLLYGRQTEWRRSKATTLTNSSAQFEKKMQKMPRRKVDRTRAEDFETSKGTTLLILMQSVEGTASSLT
jgi:GH15 family glucan-1,4-alpha-glucosidase